MHHCVSGLPICSTPTTSADFHRPCARPFRCEWKDMMLEEYWHSPFSFIAVLTEVLLADTTSSSRTTQLARPSSSFPTLLTISTKRATGALHREPLGRRNAHLTSSQQNIRSRQVGHDFSTNSDSSGHRHLQQFDRDDCQQLSVDLARDERLAVVFSRGIGIDDDDAALHRRRARPDRRHLPRSVSVSADEAEAGRGGYGRAQCRATQATENSPTQFECLRGLLGRSLAAWGR